jgi:hypothetical protein
MARCIRRATVDAFWSRESATVNGLRSVMKATFKKAALVEGVGLFPTSLGPFPVHDGDGMGSAVLQLLKTLDPGKYEKYVQCETDSGLKPVLWMQRMIDWYDARGVETGPVFRTRDEKRARQGQFELSILNRLARLQAEKPELFPDKKVNAMTDFSTRRSFRRGATSRAEIRELPGTVTDLNNRWRSVERAKGKKVNHSNMRSYYSGIRLMLVPLLKFSQAM